MSASDYAEKKLLDHLLGVAAFTMPTNIYLGLFTSDPADDGSGTEVSGNNYSRVEITTMAAATGTSPATSTHTGAITFPAASGGDWGTITHFGIFDASSGGNLLVHGSLTTAMVVVDGGPAPEFAIGKLTVTGD